MKHVSYLIFVIALSGLLGGCALLRTQPNTGYIDAVSSGQVRVCSYYDNPPPATDLDIVFWSGPQSGGPRSRPSNPDVWSVGSARIISADTHGCAMATVLTGHPRRFDVVHWSQSDPDR
jgi:hypothetical protein